jgi:hypothetical protein
MSNRLSPIRSNTENSVERRAASESPQTEESAAKILNAEHAKSQAETIKMEDGDEPDQTNADQQLLQSNIPADIAAHLGYYE